MQWASSIASHREAAGDRAQRVDEALAAERYGATYTIVYIPAGCIEDFPCSSEPAAEVSATAWDAARGERVDLIFHQGDQRETTSVTSPLLAEPTAGSCSRATSPAPVGITPMTDALRDVRDQIRLTRPHDA